MEPKQLSLHRDSGATYIATPRKCETPPLHHSTVIQRKVLTPNDFADLAEVEQRLLDFERRYETAAQPFEWKFTRSDLAKLMERIAEHEPLPQAA